MYEYNGKVTTVDDANKITVNLKVGFKLCVEQTIYLYGIDAPEIKGASIEIGTISRDKLRALILDKNVIVKTYKHSNGIYLGDVYMETSQGLLCINDWLVKEKLANYRDYKLK